MLTLVATVRGMVRWLGTKMGRDGKGWEMMSKVEKKEYDIIKNFRIAEA